MVRSLLLLQVNIFLFITSIHYTNVTALHQLDRSLIPSVRSERVAAQRRGILFDRSSQKFSFSDGALLPGRRGGQKELSSIGVLCPSLDFSCAFVL